jgi:DNA-binding response OmpR family regulator
MLTEGSHTPRQRGDRVRRQEQPRSAGTSAFERSTTVELRVFVGVEPQTLSEAKTLVLAGTPVLLLPTDAYGSNALLHTRHPESVLRVGDLELDAESRQASCRGKCVRLTPLEYGLMATLLAEPGRTRTYSELCEYVWGRPYVGDQEAVRSSLKRLRRKLDAFTTGIRLETVRAAGIRVTSSGI